MPAYEAVFATLRVVSDAVVNAATDSATAIPGAKVE